MHIIGLVGGIASGKSTVAEELAALGAVVLDADQAAHEVINLPEVKQALVERWGEDVLETSGEVNRNVIADQVFDKSNPENSELKYLESLLHPLVRQRFEKELARLARQGNLAAVIDAPLLLEAGWEDLCHSLVFVECSEADRSRRASTRNWTSGELVEREAAQMPIEQKRQRAGYVIPNHGSRKDLRRRVRAFWDEIPLPDRPT